MTPGGGGSLSAVSGGGFEGRRDSREKSSLPVVRGLPLLLLPQQVEVIWQAAADEEAAAARAVSGPASRELTQGTEASSATGTKPSHAEGSLSGVSSSAAAGNKTGPSSSDSGPPRRETGGGAQAASGQNPRGSAGGPSSGKKSVASSGQARETVAKGARDGGASAAGTKTQNASSSGTLAGASAPGCSRSGKVRPASGVTNQTSDGDGTVSSEAGTVASCVEATCRFLHLGPEGRRRPAVVDFHLFSLLFARDARMCPAKAALFVSVMGAALAEIEELAQTVSVTTLINTTKHKKAVKSNSISPEELRKTLRERFKAQSYNPFIRTGEQSANSDAAASVEHLAFPLFCQREAKRLLKFAERTLVAHCRLYLYCLKYEQREITHTHQLYTCLPLWPPKCQLSPPEQPARAADTAQGGGVATTEEPLGAEKKTGKTKYGSSLSAKHLQ